MTVLDSGKIGILVPDLSKLKLSEPNAGHSTHKIGPLYFILIRREASSNLALLFTSDFDSEDISKKLHYKNIVQL